MKKIYGVSTPVRLSRWPFKKERFGWLIGRKWLSMSGQRCFTIAISGWINICWKKGGGTSRRRSFTVLERGLRIGVSDTRGNSSTKIRPDWSWACRRIPIPSTSWRKRWIPWNHCPRYQAFRYHDTYNNISILNSIYSFYESVTNRILSFILDLFCFNINYTRCKSSLGDSSNSLNT